MKPHELSIIASVEAYERESGRELPAGSFYKSLALQYKAKQERLTKDKTNVYPSRT